MNPIVSKTINTNKKLNTIVGKAININKELKRLNNRLDKTKRLDMSKINNYTNLITIY